MHRFANVFRTVLLTALTAASATAALAYELDPVASFDQPVDVRQAPGFADRLFVVEQPGRIMVVKNDVKLATPFLDITSLVQDGGEEGLLSLAFPPDYKTSRRFYVWYVNNFRQSGSRRIPPLENQSRPCPEKLAAHRACRQSSGCRQPQRRTVAF